MVDKPLMTPAPKRRWFRYSLRTLFVVVAVLVSSGYCLWSVEEMLHWAAIRPAPADLIDDLSRRAAVAGLIALAAIAVGFEKSTED
jgi:hypothetical protein